MGSYPTYEEWKLNLFYQNIPVYTRSYPTYEEWKHEKNERA